MDTWLYLASGPGDPALNMAWDEALLEASSRLRFPVLRTYGWSHPAATFGYFQRYDEIQQLTPLRPLLRRPTGGGLVPHLCDWTYSVVIPHGHAWYELRATESYRKLHRWLQLAFDRCGVPTALAPERDSSGPGQCFVGAEADDLLHLGRKIAGAAQRRNRFGLLIQGSIQPPPPGVVRSDWEQSLRKTLQGSEMEPLIPDDALKTRASSLAAEKYSREIYHRKK